MKRKERIEKRQGEEEDKEKRRGKWKKGKRCFYWAKLLLDDVMYSIFTRVCVVSLLPIAADYFFYQRAHGGHFASASAL